MDRQYRLRPVVYQDCRRAVGRLGARSRHPRRTANDRWDGARPIADDSGAWRVRCVWWARPSLGSALLWCVYCDRTSSTGRPSPSGSRPRRRLKETSPRATGFQALSSSSQGERCGPGTIPAISGSSPFSATGFAGCRALSARRASFSWRRSCRARSRARLFCVGL